MSKHGFGDTLLYILLFPILFVIERIEDVLIILDERRQIRALRPGDRERLGGWYGRYLNRAESYFGK